MNHPVCKHINSTRFRGTGVREILWNFGDVCLSSPKLLGICRAATCGGIANAHLAINF